MSMSTPGGVRRPSTKQPSANATADGGKPDPKAGAAPTRAAAAKAGGRGAAKTAPNRPGRGSGGGAGGGGGGRSRKPAAPVVVAQTRNWGVIGMYLAAGAVALMIVGFAAYFVVNQGHKTTWQDQAAAIKGIVNYRQTQPDIVAEANRGHSNGPLTYPVSPPVGGAHNPVWQNCMGDIYTEEIPKEQAVHSLEHGAVWITYRPDLPKDQINKLGTRVAGRGFLFMSPYPGQDSPISVQAWGYQLKVDNADDRRIDQFITALRQNAGLEPGAGCSGGITTTGSTPVDLVKADGGED